MTRPFPDPAAEGSRLVVLGNGPSLKGVDLADIAYDTLGLNAAYRHWRRIDWRPTRYACLDDALIDTHADAILDLVEEGRIASFFLSGRILERRPELRDAPRVRFLDEVVPHWFLSRGEGAGLAFQDVAAFRSAEPNLLTTGAYAARYGAALGYATIDLFGMDLSYAPLQRAEPVDGIRLRVVETPDRNPNYYFDDYQREGDEFHVPNPDGHDGALHVEAFRAMRDDFVREGVRTRVFNANPDSPLSGQAIFPHRPAKSALGAPALSALVVPATQAETQQILDNLWLWAQPAFFPFLGGPPNRPPALVFVFNNAAAAEARGQIERFLEGEPALLACFGEVRFVDLELTGDADLYSRDNAATPGAQGLRAGPNNLFFGAMEAVADLPGHAFLMETDCVPLRPHWLGQASNLVSADDTPWVVGAMYSGDDPIARRDMRHANGNALYASGDPGFQRFLRTVWKPRLADLSPKGPNSRSTVSSRRSTRRLIRLIRWTKTGDWRAGFRIRCV